METELDTRNRAGQFAREKTPSTGRRVCIITAGHLSTCPRMVKAADAFAAVGHHVRVVSCRFTPWATAADTDLWGRRNNPWSWRVVDWSAETGSKLRRWSALRFRF